MSWGLSLFGSSPWGGGAGATLRLSAAESIRENVIRLTFSEAVYLSGWRDARDGLRREKFSVTADSTSTDFDGAPARAVLLAAIARVPASFGTQIDLVTDRAMSHWPSRYDVRVRDLYSMAGASLDLTATTATVWGQQQGAPRALADRAVATRDFANPQSARDVIGVAPSAATALLGTFQVDDTGDYAADQGLASLKKRIFRRLMTRKGAFRHLPGYGVGFPGVVKTLSRPGAVAALAADAEDQIRQEPEVRSVSVRLVQSVPGLVYFSVKVQTSIGGALEFDVPLVE
jgi:hypothetical protein